MTQGSPSMPRAGRHRRECGTTLIEILVSILLMSFGLLALGAMQAWSVAGAKSSGHRIVAALLAAEAADLLRANPSAFDAGEDDLAALEVRVRMELPQGGMQLSRSAAAGATGAREADLWLMWMEPRLFTHDAEGKGGSAEQAFDNCPAGVQGQAQMPRCFYMKVVF
ncbi:MAG: hypothetical protein V4757_13290 [Pseudomonadota bacterium]